MRQTYSFDDVLLVPKFSEIESRSSITIGNNLDKTKYLGLPVISSPMDTVTEDTMALAMDAAGGLGVVHRYNTVQEQASIISKALYSNQDMKVAAAVGMTDYEARAKALVSIGVQIICVDVAHGHHTLMEGCLKSLKDMFGTAVHLMAGNVATLEGFNALASWGADSIRVGIGGGSICSTRLVTGHGVPTFQSILDCSRTTYDAKIIADGGIRTTGDMVKAYAAGADFVIVGSMLAGTKETPGEVFFGQQGKRYKVYRGMASAAAQKSWRGKTTTPEGVSTTIPFCGAVEGVLRDIAGGLRSGLSYSGAASIRELQAKSEFVLQSNAGQAESTTHILQRYK